MFSGSFTTAWLNLLILAGSNLPWAFADQPAPAKKEPNIAVEIRIVSIPESTFAELSKNTDLFGKPSKNADTSTARPLATLSPREVYFLLNFTQQNASCNVMQAPRLVGRTGENLHVELVQACPTLKTEESAVSTDAKVFYQPKFEAMKLGTQFTVCTNIAKNAKDSHSIHLESSLTTLAYDSVECANVKVVTCPAGKRTKEPKASTGQTPTICRLSLDETFELKDGETALLGGWKRTEEVRSEWGPPILSEIPYVNRLFNTVGYFQEDRHLFVLVTPRRLNAEE